MITLTILAAFLILLSTSAGWLILETLGPIPGSNLDRLFVSYWIGHSLLLIVATALVCALPLRVASFPVIVTGIILILFTIRSLPRIEWPHPLRRFVYPAGALIVFLCVAAACSTSWTYDTGLYHYQLVNWFRTFGAVPGLALLHHRLGYISSVFALTAIFDGGPFAGSVGGLVNLGTLIVCWLFAAANLALAIFTKPTTLRLYWVACVIVMLPILRPVISTSPDFLACLLPLVFCWLLLLWQSEQPAQVSSLPHVFVIIGASAVSVKASGLALFLICVSISTYLLKDSRQRVYKCLIIAAILVLPTLTLNAILSGYPLYPVLAIKLPVPWALTATTYVVANSSVQNFPLFAYSEPYPMSLPNKLIHLFYVDNWYLFSAAILNIVGIVLIIRNKTSKEAICFAATGALALLGVLMVVRVPAARFSLGYIFAIPVLAIASSGRRWLAYAFGASLCIWAVLPLKTLNRLDVLRLLVYCAVLLLLIFARRIVSMRAVVSIVVILMVFQYMRPLMDAGHTVWASRGTPSLLLVPGRIPVLTERELRSVRKGRVTLRQPIGYDQSQCWATEPPCVPNDFQASFGTVLELRYRDPARGLAGGFVQTR